MRFVYRDDYGYIRRDDGIRAIISRDEFPGLCVTQGASEGEWRISHIESGRLVIPCLWSIKDACRLAAVLATAEEAQADLDKWAAKCGLKEAN